MKRPAITINEENRQAFAALLEVCRKFKFESHDIARHLDTCGHYELSLDKEFPFNIRLFHFSPKHYTPTWNWHDR